MNGNRKFCAMHRWSTDSEKVYRAIYHDILCFPSEGDSVLGNDETDDRASFATSGVQGATFHSHAACPLTGSFQKELQTEEAELDAEGGAGGDEGSRMLRDEVTPDDIASVVAAWTGDLSRQYNLAR